MKQLYRIAFLSLSLAIFQTANSQQVSSSMDTRRITAEVENFLKQQTSNLGDETEIIVRPIDSRLKLQACEQMTPFLPPGSKVWGKVTVGIRCDNPKPWTLYASAQVRVFGDFYVTKNAVSAGQTLTEQDITKVRGELSNQPAGLSLQTQLIIGKTSNGSYPAGVSIRQDMFKTVPVIQQGQNIKIYSQGVGFRVSNEGIALNNASEGQVTRAKTNNGILITGIARAGGFIEVQ